MGFVIVCGQQPDKDSPATDNPAADENLTFTGVKRAAMEGSTPSPCIEEKKAPFGQSEVAEDSIKTPTQAPVETAPEANATFESSKPVTEAKAGWLVGQWLGIST